MDPATGTVQNGPDLPKIAYQHCLVMVNSSTAMLIGGQQIKPETWFYNFDNAYQGWTRGPDLNVGRVRHACGVIKDSADESKTIVVVAGGEFTKSSEILVVNSQPLTWIIGPEMPNAINDASGIAAPDGKSFYFVGGNNWDRSGYEDAIYKLQCRNTNCTWTKMFQELKVARQEFVATFLPDSMVNC